ncbi:unnamed protein product [Allacma fusca]|uniref:Rho GTPase n=1 Tax=Allacma fusca TaxID=39272 RepID=A0A8J2PFB9_9HEXA|nr:unnamed protein product [Allacma fusca]
MELTDATRELNIVVVGDDFCGKSCLIGSYLTNEFSDEYRPNMHETHFTEITLKGKRYNLNIHDIPGSDSYCKVHPCDYPQANCFIVCFAINDENSLKNIQTKWIPEIKHSCPEASFILVGTKSDLKNSPSQPVIPLVQCKAQCKSIGVKSFLECSAKTNEGAQKVFETTIKTVLKPVKRKPGKSQQCKCYCSIT